MPIARHSSGPKIIAEIISKTALHIVVSYLITSNVSIIICI